MKFFFSLGLFLISSIAMAGQVYRYKDDQGHSIVEQQISSQAIKRGYTILDDHGNFVGTVKPASELQQQQKQKQKAVQEAKEREQTALIEKQQQEIVELQPVNAPLKPIVVSGSLAISDEKLLELFKTPEDAMRVRERKLQDLDTAIGFLRGRLQFLQAEQQIKIAEAAALEFNGKPVPAIYMTHFVEQINQLQQAKTDLLAKQNERQALKLDYDHTIQRLRVLVGANKSLQATQAGS